MNSVYSHIVVHNFNNEVNSPVLPSSHHLLNVLGVDTTSINAVNRRFAPGLEQERRRGEDSHFEETPSGFAIVDIVKKDLEVSSRSLATRPDAPIQQSSVASAPLATEKC